MRILQDYEGRAIRLTDERLAHVLDHPEMVGMEAAIEETLLDPEVVVRSISDQSAHLYYHFYVGTPVGEKYICVVVKLVADDAFVLTAYLTDKTKKGTRIWPSGM